MPAIAGREREEDVAGARRAEAADAREAEGRPAGKPVALVRQQRRVGRDDADDRAGAGERGRPMRSRAARAPTAMAPRRARDLLADRHAVDAQQAAATVVRLDEDADGPAAVVRPGAGATTSRSRP